MPTKKSSSSHPVSPRKSTPKKAPARKAAPKKSSSRRRPVKPTSPGPGTPATPGTPTSGTPTPGRRIFADPVYVPLPAGNVPDGEVSRYDAYASVLQKIPKPRISNLVMQLADVIGQDAVDAIKQTGRIVFHSVGDTGADKEFRVVDEADVTALMVKDLASPIPAERPSFFYHLGDVVYEFGQPDCYYAQFYEPFCMYNAPIFAIPGNHDGMVWDPSMESLQAFQANFCSPTPTHADNAGSIMRYTMDQPGVYFTLEAPFVTIIGLYSNVVDKGPGIISSENNPKYKNIVSDDQKNWLISELKRLAPIRKSNQTAVILAVHHPPFTGHSSTANTLGADLDDAFKQGGLLPDLVISGHAHLYERFQRDVNGIKLPYIIAGCGGYNLSPFGKASDPNVKVPPSMSGDPSLQAYFKTFGYMKIKVTADQLAVIFNSIDANYGAACDSILIDLKTHVVTEGKKGREPL